MEKILVNPNNSTTHNFSTFSPRPKRGPVRPAQGGAWSSHFGQRGLGVGAPLLCMPLHPDKDLVSPLDSLIFSRKT